MTAYAPVTPEQAAANVALLEAELDEYEAGRREMFRVARAAGLMAPAVDRPAAEAAARAAVAALELADADRRIAAVRPLARDITRCARLRDAEGARLALERVGDWPALCVVLAACVGLRGGIGGDAGALASFTWARYAPGVAAVLARTTDWRALALELARHADPRRVMAVTSPAEITETERAGAA